MNRDRLYRLFDSAQVVPVLGSSRSGVSLLASQLASSLDGCLLEAGPDLPNHWLLNLLSADLLPDDLVLELSSRIVEIHGAERLERPIDRLVLPLRPSDWQALASSTSDFPPGHAVLIARQPADVVCSLARFPHLQPQLPCPRQHRISFLKGALKMLQQQELLLSQLCQRLMSRGFVVHRLTYEELVADPAVIVRLCHNLGFPRSEVKPLAGISPSLCFRERPLDQAGVGRWQRQLHSDELAKFRLAPSVQKSLDSPEASPPLILTGRGGSGTRLLADALRGQGVDLGARLNPSSDSIHWADLLYEMVLSSLQGHCSPWSGSWSEELRHRARCLSLGRLSAKPWGFKLPEAMLVLNTLLQTWPRSTVVHLVRHPLDTCLRRTHMTSRTSNPVGKALLEQAYRTLERPQRPDDDPPHLRNAVSWWYQLQEIQRVREHFPGRVIEIRYEDLCDCPQETINALMQALGSQSRPVGLPVDSSRRRRWNAGDERIGEVWALCGPLAETYGYRVES